MITRQRLIKRALVGLAALYGIKDTPVSAIPESIDPYPQAAYTVRMDPSALVASGGFCAPMSPIYSMPIASARPIRDALPSLSAKRGGISTSST